MTPDSPLAPHLRRTTIGVLALVSLVAFEAMAVATAMPVAARALDGLVLYAWAFTGFLITSLFATAVAGDLCDRFGPRPAVVGGVVVFALGLALAGAATSMVMFVAGRLVQGLGAGGIIVGIYVLIGQAYPDRLRPRIFSYLSAAWVIPAVVGPVVAGTVAENLTWRLVFYGLLPLVVAPVVLLWPLLCRAGPAEPAARLPGRVWLALVLAVGGAALQLGGQQLEHGAVPLGTATIATGAVLVGLSLRRLLPAGTLRLRRGLPSVVLLRGVQAGAFFGVEAFLPLMLVEHRGLSPTLAGASLTGAALGWSAGAWWQGRPGLSIDRQRLAVAGSLLVLAGLVLTSSAVVAPTVPPVTAAVGWVIAGSGMGITLSTLSVLLFRLAPPGEEGSSSAALQLSDALGCVLTVGLGGVLYAALHDRAGAVAAAGGGGGEVDIAPEFAAVFAVMITAQVLAVLVARRVLPRPGRQGAPALRHVNVA